MNTLEFMQHKNRIIERATGIVLIPEEQMVEVEVRKLRLGCDADACPYCMVYNRGENEHNPLCTNCPMQMANNACEENMANTYNAVYSSLKVSITDKNSPVYDEIAELICWFNEENGFND